MSSSQDGLDEKGSLGAKRTGLLFVTAIESFAQASQGQPMVPFIKSVAAVIVAEGRARGINLAFYLPAMRHLTIRAIEMAV